MSYLDENVESLLSFFGISNPDLPRDESYMLPFPKRIMCCTSDDMCAFRDIIIFLKSQARGEVSLFGIKTHSFPRGGSFMFHSVRTRYEEDAIWIHSIIAEAEAVVVKSTYQQSGMIPITDVEQLGKVIDRYVSK